MYVNKYYSLQTALYSWLPSRGVQVLGEIQLGPPPTHVHTYVYVSGLSVNDEIKFIAYYMHVYLPVQTDTVHL